MTPQELKEIEQAATPAPWVFCDVPEGQDTLEGTYRLGASNFSLKISLCPDTGKESLDEEGTPIAYDTPHYNGAPEREDAKLMAAARNLLPLLLALWETEIELAVCCEHATKYHGDPYSLRIDDLFDRKAQILNDLAAFKQG